MSVYLLCMAVLFFTLYLVVCVCCEYLLAMCVSVFCFFNISVIGERLLLLAIGSELHFFLLLVLHRTKVNSLVTVLFRLRCIKLFILFSSTILIGSQSHPHSLSCSLSMRENYRSTHFSSMNVFGSLHFLLVLLLVVLFFGIGNRT